MPTKSYRQALNEALMHEMQRDENVLIIGEDVAGGAGDWSTEDAYGGALGVTKGLIGAFGPDRVIDTPISESAIVGMATGAANTGLRPIAELMFVDFIGVCLDQIMNQAAKVRYMFGGQASTPLVIRTIVGAGFRCGSQHSQMLHPMLTHIPGLKVALPSSPYEAKGLLIEAIRDNDPVIFLEHKALYDTTGEVPDEAYSIPFGEANILREGKDASVVAFSRQVGLAVSVADRLKEEGIGLDVIDPRTTSPLDTDTILESVRKTGRLVVVDESSPRCGMAADIASIVQEAAFECLAAPVLTVTPPHVPVPFAPNLEDDYMPSEQDIEERIRTILAFEK